ncbi:hypothetical protein C8R45DRAFT_927548 [Mycena sanguinolenta]|nr:hypothetical protein C8R45DRAFT_927548 [Mycena sanguinolenta]
MATDNCWCLAGAATGFASEGRSSHDSATIIQADSVIAALLSENPQKTAILVEAGVSLVLSSDRAKRDGTDSAVLSVLFLAGQAVSTVFDWSTKIVPPPVKRAGMNGHQMSYPRGFVLGGSSNISTQIRAQDCPGGDLGLDNMLYSRGPSKELDQLADTDGDDGCTNSVSHCYIAQNEKHILAWNDRSNVGELNPKVHGRGPLMSSLTTNPLELGHRVLNTTTELSHEFPINLDFNSGDGLGFGAGCN